MSTQKAYTVRAKLTPAAAVRAAAAVAIPVTIINESSHVIRANGSVALKYDKTGEVVGLTFGQINPGQQQTQTANMNDEPDQASYGFIAADDAGAWTGFLTPVDNTTTPPTPIQFPGLNLHIQNPE
jgi:hypothetical protein